MAPDLPDVMAMLEAGPPTAVVDTVAGAILAGSIGKGDATNPLMLVWLPLLLRDRAGDPSTGRVIGMPPGVARRDGSGGVSLE